MKVSPPIPLKGEQPMSVVLPEIDMDPSAMGSGIPDRFRPKNNVTQPGNALINPPAKKAVTDPTGMGPDAPEVPATVPLDDEESVPVIAPRANRKIRKPKPIEVKRDDRMASVPDASYGETYVGRDIEGVNWIKVFDIARVQHMNVLLEGPTGSGKTHAVMAYAAIRNLPFYSVSSSVGIEPTQLFGKFVPDETQERGLRWQDGPVTDLVRHGGVLLINEMNFIPERISTVLFSLLDKRRVIQLVDHHGEVIKAHKELLIVADLNPNYEGTRPLNRALRNRFAVQLHWDYDPSIEAELIPNDGLRTLAFKIRTDPQTGGITTPVSTNMLIEFDRIVRATGSVQFAAMNFLNHWPVVDQQYIDVILKAVIVNISREYEKEGVL